MHTEKPARNRANFRLAFVVKLNQNHENQGCYLSWRPSNCFLIARSWRSFWGKSYQDSYLGLQGINKDISYRRRSLVWGFASKIASKKRSLSLTIIEWFLNIMKSLYYLCYQFPIPIPPRVQVCMHCQLCFRTFIFVDLLWLSRQSKLL